MSTPADLQAFRADFLQAVNSGVDEKELVEIVVRYKDQGVSQREAYTTLETLYFDLGCGEARYDEDPVFCDRIGDVLDLAWGTYPVIWPTNLGDERIQ